MRGPGRDSKGWDEGRWGTWRPRGLSKSVISRVIIGLTLFRVLITPLITYLLSPLGLQVIPKEESLATVDDKNPALPPPPHPKKDYA